MNLIGTKAAKEQIENDELENFHTKLIIFAFSKTIGLIFFCLFLKMRNLLLLMQSIVHCLHELRRSVRQEQHNSNLSNRLGR